MLAVWIPARYSLLTHQFRRSLRWKSKFLFIYWKKKNEKLLFMDTWGNRSQCFGRKAKRPHQCIVNMWKIHSEIELCLSIDGNRSNLLLYVSATLFSLQRSMLFFSLHLLGIFNRSKAGVISVMPKIHQQLKWTPDTINEDEQPLMGLCTVCCKRNWNTQKKRMPETECRETKKRNSNRWRCKITHT